MFCWLSFVTVLVLVLVFYVVYYYCFAGIDAGCQVCRVEAGGGGGLRVGGKGKRRLTDHLLVSNQYTQWNINT